MWLSRRATHAVIYDGTIFCHKEGYVKTDSCFVCTYYWCKSTGRCFVFQMVTYFGIYLKVETDFLQRFPNFAPSLRGQ